MALGGMVSTRVARRMDGTLRPEIWMGAHTAGKASGWNTEARKLVESLHHRRGERMACGNW
jgi:hypothetical protein